MRHWGRAIEHFETALAMNRRIGARPWAVLTLRDYARALLERDAPGDRRKAGLLLVESQSEAAALGMSMIENEISGLRTKSGGMKSSLIYPDGLTGREVDVLSHLAAGKSNREIARAMGLSLHTIERHIANIYVKINVHNRTQAACYALEKKLAPSAEPQTT